MHSAICKGMLKVGFWEAQKGAKNCTAPLGRRNSERILGCTWQRFVVKTIPWLSQKFFKIHPLDTRGIRWKSEGPL